MSVCRVCAVDRTRSRGVTSAASVRLDTRYLVVSFFVSVYLVWIWEMNANVIMGRIFAVVGG